MLETQKQNKYDVEIVGQKKRTTTAETPQEAITKIAKELFKCDVDITPVKKGFPKANVRTILLNAERKSEQWYMVKTSSNVIYVHKRPDFTKPRDVFKLCKPNDIPDFLKQSVEFVDRIVEESSSTDEHNDPYIRYVYVLHSLEGDEKITTLSTIYGDNTCFIAYEVLDPNKTDVGKIKKAKDGKYYNVWWKKNGNTTLIEKNGKYYGKDPIVQASLTTENFPYFLGNEAKSRLKQVEGGWLYKVNWNPNPLKATNNKGFWVKYGVGDFNFLQAGTPSSAAYDVVDEEGNVISTLDAYYKHLTK